MLLTLLTQSLLNRKKAVAVMIIAVAAGTAVAASLLMLSFDVSAKVSKELRRFGANIMIQPQVRGLAGLSGQQRYLREEDLVKAKTIFWRHNIVGLAPALIVSDPERGYALFGTWHAHALPVPGETAPFVTGVDTVMPWWRIDGAWPRGDDEVLAGALLAERLGVKRGDRVTFLGRELRLSGVVTTGGSEDEMLVGELAAAQRIAGLRGRISKVFVSAMTTPMDDFAYRDPNTMTRVEFEKWYCTGYVTSIAKQLEEVFAGSVARPVWPVAETEGDIMRRLGLLVAVLTALALLGASLSMSATMIMSLLRRTAEVALMKAIGADSLRTSLIFLAEAVLIGLAGGLAGAALSFLAAPHLGTAVFGTRLEHSASLFPLTVLVSVLIAALGSWLPIRRALSIRPGVALRGGL